MSSCKKKINQVFLSNARQLTATITLQSNNSFYKFTIKDIPTATPSTTDIPTTTDAQIDLSTSNSEN